MSCVFLVAKRVREVWRPGAQLATLEASLRSDKGSPSFATLRKYARACGKRLIVRLV